MSRQKHPPKHITPNLINVVIWVDLLYTKPSKLKCCVISLSLKNQQIISSFRMRMHHITQLTEHGTQRTNWHGSSMCQLKLHKSCCSIHPPICYQIRSTCQGSIFTHWMESAANYIREWVEGNFLLAFGISVELQFLYLVVCSWW